MCFLCDFNQAENPHKIHRRGFIAGAIASAFIPETVNAEKLDNTPKLQNMILPDDALQRLMDGNQHFLNGSEKNKILDLSVRRYYMVRILLQQF
jgi:carbonic anhydrase